MIVMKFGGSCISSKDNLENLVSVVKENIEKKPIVVVSALSGVTARLKEISAELHEFRQKKELKQNDLFQKADSFYTEILKKYEDLGRELGFKFYDISLNSEFHNSLVRTDTYYKRFRDFIMSIGERYSSRLVAEYLKKQGIEADAYDSFDLGLITDSNFGNAHFKRRSFDYIGRKMKKRNSTSIPVITGFIGKDEEKSGCLPSSITTMGPNSSDLTAVIFGVALGAEEIYTYKTVDGVLTADPNKVDNPITIPNLSYEEASELAAYGADVMSPKAVKLASLFNKEIKVLNIKNPGSNYTIISKETDDAEIKGVTSKSNTSLITISSPEMIDQVGFAARIYEILRNNNISADIFASSGVTLSNTIDPYADDRKRKDEARDFTRLNRSLAKYGDVSIEEEKSIISLVGRSLIDTPGILAKVFTTVARDHVNVEMASLGKNSCNLTFVVGQEHESKVVRSLHKEFFE